MMNLMIPVLDGQAVASAAALGKAMVAEGVAFDDPAVVAVVESAPADLQPRMIEAIAAAYEAAAVKAAA